MIKPIRDGANYEKALVRVESLMNAVPNTDEFDELEVFSTLVENYEQKYYVSLPVIPNTKTNSLVF